MENETDLYTTADLTLVMHFHYNGIKPVRRTVDNDRAVLH